MTATPASLPADATSKSHRDLAVARQIARYLSRHRDVEAIAVGGSIARGIGDEFSDLDVFVYCSEFPPEADRRALLETLSPERWKTHAEHAGSGLVVDAFLCGETEVDLNLLLVKTVEACMRAVLEKHDLTPRIQSFVGGFSDALPLYGERQCEAWRRRVAVYPEPLARKMVEEHLAIEPLYVPGIDGCREGDLLGLYEALCRVQRGVLGILLGLNRQYAPPIYKRSRRLLGSMAIKPERAAERLEETFALDAATALGHLRALVHETFDLVETHMPELDVPGARKRFTTNPALAAAP